MSDAEVRKLQELLLNWKDVFPISGNLAELHFGVPSSLIRFDYVMKDGSPYVYEVEERPAGLGVTSVIHPTFAQSVIHFFKEKEGFLDRKVAIYISPGRDGTSDDDVFSAITGVPVFRGEKEEETVARYAWYVRSHRHEDDVSNTFTSHAISTLRHEGDKRYGVPLGLWKELSKENEIDFSLPFAVKPKTGSRFEGVLLYHPDKKMGAGFATKTKVLDAVSSGKVHFIQPYARGEEALFLGQEYHLMRRAYFVFSPEAKRYVSLGGLWLATPTARVHGTKEAVTGVLLTP
ncbi:MAG: hypothetical protein KBC21_00355 [Candidatus Pacebacteria bacterium]|nr:hypothetical protein [Candidatus Paceibacterota bacterium]